LIICSDVDGLYDVNPRLNSNARLIAQIDKITPELFEAAVGTGGMGTGGMFTKLQAADKCTRSGIQTLIINGQKGEVFDNLLDGDVHGSWFKPAESHDSARRKWLKYTLVSKGQIIVDEGAAKALNKKGASLLPKGIKEVGGHFNAGDAVEIVCQNQSLAKGISVYSMSELNSIKGLHSDRIVATLGYSLGEAAVHRDDLVLL
jgi:glutamate 5-kinase